MASDSHAGQVGYTTVAGNQDNLAPADRLAYDPKAVGVVSQPGAAARANGYPRKS
jgi:hypothetical protein